MPHRERIHILFGKAVHATGKRRRAIRIAIQNETARPAPQRMTPGQRWRFLLSRNATIVAHGHP